MYLQMCKEYKYFALFIEPQTPWCFEADELATRNSHGVPEDILAKKVWFTINSFDILSPFGKTYLPMLNYK